jgi:hypothetical protein
MRFQEGHIEAGQKERSEGPEALARDEERV